MARPRATPRPSRRRADQTASNPNHHLWQHGKNWWVYCAVNPTPRTKDKLRRSLCTEDVEEARMRRDELFRRLQAEGMLGRIRALPVPDEAAARAVDPANAGVNWKQRVDTALAAAIALTISREKLSARVVRAGEGRLQLCYS